MADYRSGFGGMEDYRRVETMPITTINRGYNPVDQPEEDDKGRADRIREEFLLGGLKSPNKEHADIRMSALQTTLLSQEQVRGNAAERCGMSPCVIPSPRLWSLPFLSGRANAPLPSTGPPLTRRHYRSIFPLLAPRPSCKCFPDPRPSDRRSWRGWCHTAQGGASSGLLHPPPHRLLHHRHYLHVARGNNTSTHHNIIPRDVSDILFGTAALLHRPLGKGVK